jgi:F420H(2)-dependent quinone reductase
MAEPWLPPRWVKRSFWRLHRAVHRLSGGRLGLRSPIRAGERTRYGMLRLTTIGRHSGRPREVILAYLEDGPNLTTLAMNGWDEPEPAWWLNLQAHPEVTVDLADGPRQVRAYPASGEQRERLWQAWREVDRNLDGYAAKRSKETAVVVLEPR